VRLGAVLIWLLAAERRGLDDDAIRESRGARRSWGASLFVLAAYIALDAILALGTAPGPARPSRRSRRTCRVTATL
jgi:hypothetical protein